MKKTKKSINQVYIQRYTLEDISKWAECYKKVGSFAKVSNMFANTNKKTIVKYLKLHKDAFGLTFSHDQRNELKKQGLKKCMGSCGLTMSIDEFEFKRTTNSYRSICKKCRSLLNKEYREKNKDKITEYMAQYRANNKEKISSASKLRYQENRSAMTLVQRQYYSENKSDIRSRRRNRHIVRMQEDTNYKLRYTLRGRISSAIKNRSKVGSAIVSLGCSIPELKGHLEGLFYHHPKTKEKMSWDNYGYYGWHIDHIIPLVSFDLENREEFLRACHYTNLQPLWAKENFSKGAKTSKEFSNAL